MKQFSWNHIDQQGKIHKVGLLHGSKTGHVLIHVNGRISSIDFKVLDTKQYSFFINEELIELNIIRHKDHFEYTMEINEEVKTPLNTKRKEERKKMGFQTLAFVLALALAIIGGTMWMLNSDWYKNKNIEDYKLLSTQGVLTKARLYRDSEETYSYHYVAKGTPISKVAPINNYPIEDGDEYMVQFLPRRPEISEVQFVAPTDNQLLRAVRNAVDVCMQSDASKSESACICMAETGYAVDGYNGLISMLNKNTPVEVNSQFNAATYTLLINAPAFKTQLSANCKQ